MPHNRLDSFVESKSNEEWAGLPHARGIHRHLAKDAAFSARSVKGAQNASRPAPRRARAAADPSSAQTHQQRRPSDAQARRGGGLGGRRGQAARQITRQKAKGRQAQAQGREGATRTPSSDSARDLRVCVAAEGCAGAQRAAKGTRNHTKASRCARDRISTYRTPLPFIPHLSRASQLSSTPCFQSLQQALR